MQPQLTEEQVRHIIRDEFQKFIKSDRYIFEKDIQILDAHKIHIGTTKGLNIGDNLDMVGSTKIGFLGKDAIVAYTPGGAATASGTYGGTEQNMLQSAYNCLRAFGLLA